MRRKAFWGRAIARQVPGLVNGELVNFGINEYGVQFARRDNGQLSRLIPWAELHRLAQHNPLEQLGAAVAERSKPVEGKIIEYDGRKFVRTGVSRSPRTGDWYMTETLTNNHPAKALMNFTSQNRELLREIVEEK